MQSMEVRYRTVRWNSKKYAKRVLFKAERCLFII